LNIRNKLKLVKISEIKEYKGNAKLHSPEQVEQIKKSIEKHEYINPVIVGTGNVIICGHGRIQALREIDPEQTVEVVDVGYLSEKDQKKLRILDNKIISDEWDKDLLQAEIEDIYSGFDDVEGMIDELSIDEKELNALLPEPETDGDDDIPEDVKPVTKLGDLWELGDHRVLCGDSTKEEDVNRLMGGNKADMVFTDPPYKIETEGGCKGEIGKGLRKQGESIEFISDFNPSGFLRNIKTVFNKNFNSYIFCNKELLPDYLFWAKENKISFNVLVWKKPTAIPIGDSHRPDIEYLLLLRKNAIWNNGLKDVNYSRCLEYGRESGLHPTMKPVDLVENEIKISSNKNSRVVDFFCGSGSTLIACEKTNRKCFGMELDEKYTDIIRDRYIEFCIKNNKEPIVKLNGEIYNP
jgi:DNA modification methylase